MSSGSAAKEFEAFARDCVQLVELRERLLSMARDWMRAAMEEDDLAPSMNRALRRKRSQPSRGAALTSAGTCSLPRRGRHFGGRKRDGLLWSGYRRG